MKNDYEIILRETMQPLLTDAQFDELMKRLANNEYCSPYHEEPMNEFIENMQLQFNAPHNLRVITEHLPYAIVDVMNARNIDGAAQDAVQALYIKFLKKSVEQIMQFELQEY